MKNSAVIFTILLAFAVCSCQKSGFHRTEGSVWHTVYHITYNPAGKDPVPLDDSIQIVLDSVEHSVSAFCKNSVVTAINNNCSVKVDGSFKYIFWQSVDVWQRSEGMFDPSVGPLVDIWGFGTDGATSVVPDSSRIAGLLATVGLGKFVLSGDTLAKPSEKSRLNFSAIAKGYGCDRVAAMLRRNGVRDYMVEIGGEIALGGVNPHGEVWRIMVDRPETDTCGVSHNGIATLKVSDCGIATSGNYRNFRTMDDGSRAAHTVSPLTGYPVFSKTLSATVVASEASLADALATACMAMDEADAVAMIEGYGGVSAMLVLEGDSGAYRIKTVGPLWKSGDK